MINAKTGKILITKPTWPVNEEYCKYWNLLREFFSSEYSNFKLIEFPVSPGLSGKLSVERLIRNHQNNYDLIVAHHIDKRFAKCIDFKPAYLKSLWYFGNNGYSGFSNLGNIDFLSKTVDDESVYDEFYQTRIKRYTTHTKYDRDNKSKVEENIPKDILFIPLQVENDTVMALKHITTMGMISRVMSASRSLQIPIVIKFHPKSPKTAPYRRAIEELVKAHSSYMYISNGDVRDLIDRSQAIFVINSGVGFEGLLKLKRVFTFGKSDYHQATHYNYEIPEIINAFNTSVDEMKIKKVLYHWWQEIIDFNIDGHEEKIKEKLSICLGI